jgi:hypothetical protein
VVWPGAQSGLLGRGEVVVELEAPRRWWRWWRRRAPSSFHSETRHRLKTCNQISERLWGALSGEG